MTKTEIIDKLNSILEDAENAKDEASYAEDKADCINENCELGEVTSYAEDASSGARECQSYLEYVTNGIESLIEIFDNGDELEDNDKTAIFDEMISELKRTTEEKLASFECVLDEKERTVNELGEQFNRLTEDIHNEFNKLEKEIKGDE